MKFMSLFLAVILNVANVQYASAVDHPILTIQSPEDGTLVTPGSDVQISVTTTDTRINQVSLVAETPFPIVPAQTGSRIFSFTVTIPADINPDLYHITALGIGDTGIASEPTSIGLIVTPDSAPNSLKVTPSNATLRYVGSETSLDLSGVFPNGVTSNLTSAPGVSWSSLDSSIASVSNNGVVTGLAVGSTKIEAAFQSLINPQAIATIQATITVKANTNGDFTNDNRVDIDDINVIKDVLNTPAKAPNDARDLNHDKKIDALDARILTTLCTYPRCATHP